MTKCKFLTESVCWCLYGFLKNWFWLKKKRCFNADNGIRSRWELEAETHSGSGLNGSSVVSPVLFFFNDFVYLTQSEFTSWLEQITFHSLKISCTLLNKWKWKESCSDELLSCFVTQHTTLINNSLASCNTTTLTHYTNVYSPNKYYLYRAKTEKRRDVVSEWWWEVATLSRGKGKKISCCTANLHFHCNLAQRALFPAQSHYIPDRRPDLVEDVSLQVKAHQLELQPRWGPPHWWRWRWPWSSAGTGGLGRGAGCHSPASPSQSVFWSPGAPMGPPHD